MLKATFHSLVIWVLLGLLLGGLWACKKKKDEERINLPPTTYLEVDTIIRSGASRLTSSVRLRWSGSDADGFTKGYQIVWGFAPATAADWASAKIVANTDSVFLFGFPEGATDTANIYFSVRAIDNLDQVDPTPPSVVIPIKNNPPTVEIVNTTFPTGDTVLTAFSLRYNANDPDGFDNIAKLLFRINDGDWLEIPRSSKFLTMLPKYENQVFTGLSEVYLGENLSLSLQKPVAFNATVTGLLPGSTNKFYFKIFDQAGDSAEVETPSWHMKSKSNDFLVIDAYRGNIQPSPESIYFPIFQSTAGGFDLLRYDAPYRSSNIQFFNTTFYLYLSLFKKIFWYGDNPLALEETINSFGQYLRFDGKAMFVSTFPATPRLEKESAVFPFFGLDSIAPTPASLLRSAVIDSLIPGFRKLGLQSESFITGVYFLYPRIDADTIMRVPASSLRSAPVYTGKRMVATRQRNQANNRTNLIFSCLELHRFGRNPGSLEATFNYIINEEFNW